jgi:type II secretory pathway component PulK
LALLVVSWLVVVLSLWSVLFLRESLGSGAASSYATSKLRARVACDSAQAVVLAFLAQPEQRVGAGQVQPWASSVESFAAIDISEGVRAAVVAYDFDRATLRYGLGDEASRLHLRIATAEMLQQLPGMTEEVAAAILDWADDDDEPQEFGAEGEFYALLTEHPYEPKNEAFETLAELLLVKGIDPALLFGEDLNLNGRLDAGEDLDGDGVLQAGLWRYLTLWSYEPNVNAQGTERIDLNTASREELAAALGDRVNDEQLQVVIAARSGSLLVSVGQLATLPRWNVELLKTVIDDVTVHAEPLIVGRINVVTAPREVLRAIPGLDEDAVDALLSAREGRADGLDTLGWVIDALGIELFSVIANWITISSYQFRCQLQGWTQAELEGDSSPAPRAFSRRLCVLDVAGETPRVLYRRDLDRFGPLRLPE